MSIQWFPGHMTAAKKKAEEALETNDLVIEILDARIPGSSTNPMIDVMRKERQRPCLKILNKSDLADPSITKGWLDYFNAIPHTKAISISAKSKGDIKKILPLCLKLAPHRNSSIKPLRMLIMGVPNVGKSTIINAIHHKKIAKVGNEPAVTKQQQRIILNGSMILTDTPGMMWPKISNEIDGYYLAASHTIGINAYDEVETALFLFNAIKDNYGELLVKKYKIEKPFPKEEEFLSQLAKKRGFFVKGGHEDFYKAATTLLNDYRQGVLGRISLESPVTREIMLNKLAANQSNNSSQA
jgi:ribosome biogenesis GTPase A